MLFEMFKLLLLLFIDGEWKGYRSNTGDAPC